MLQMRLRHLQFCLSHRPLQKHVKKGRKYEKPNQNIQTMDQWVRTITQCKITIRHHNQQLIGNCYIVTCISLLSLKVTSILLSLFFYLTSQLIYWHIFLACKLIQLNLCVAILDFGQPSNICTKCQAQVWFEERPDKSTLNIRGGFSICCMKGKVTLPGQERPPDLLFKLSTGLDPRARHFYENIRVYNSMFSFTSMGGKIENHANDGGGPPQFIISWQNCHRMGSLLPEDNQKPRFAQMYVYDTQNEMQNRLFHFRYNSNSLFC